MLLLSWTYSVLQFPYTIKRLSLSSYKTPTQGSKGEDTHKKGRWSKKSSSKIYCVCVLRAKFVLWNRNRILKFHHLWHFVLQIWEITPGLGLLCQDQFLNISLLGHFMHFKSYLPNPGIAPITLCQEGKESIQLYTKLLTQYLKEHVNNRSGIW